MRKLQFKIKFLSVVPVLLPAIILMTGCKKEQASVSGATDGSSQGSTTEIEDDQPVDTVGKSEGKVSDTDSKTETQQKDEAANQPSSKASTSAKNANQSTKVSGPAPTPKEPVSNKGVNGNIIIEDYTYDDSGLKNLKKALAQASFRPVRIAVLGDSYIEGDIFTMNLRESLQKQYGGAGVGYVPAYSHVAGFRQTVSHTASGWTEHDIRKKMSDDMKTLPGEYYTSGGQGKSTYKGVSSLSNLDKWDQSMVLAMAPKGGKVTLGTDSGTSTFDVPAGDSVHALKVPGNTTKFTVDATNGVDVLGVYLDNATGISLDNMSIRGYAGLKHSSLSVERAAQLRPYADYSLIIFEYGINALEANRKDYSGYKKQWKQTIEKLKECYPAADIIVMGIGDRAMKSGGQVKSIATSQNMVDALRDVARETGVLFWDTRAAMGGENAAIEWHQRKLINGDYIHLNAKGGKELSDLFFNALTNSLNK